MVPFAQTKKKGIGCKEAGEGLGAKDCQLSCSLTPSSALFHFLLLP